MRRRRSSISGSGTSTWNGRTAVSALAIVVSLMIVSLSFGHCGCRAARQLPVRSDEVARVPARVALEIVLVLGFGLPERPSRRHFGDDLAGPQSRRVHVRNGVFGHRALLFGEKEDRGPVTRANVVALPVHRRRIVNLEEELEQVAIRELVGIKDDLDRLGVTLVVVVGGVRNVAARVADARRGHTRKLADEVLHPPETASGEDCGFTRLCHRRASWLRDRGLTQRAKSRSCSLRKRSHMGLAIAPVPCP